MNELEVDDSALQHSILETAEDDALIVDGDTLSPTGPTHVEDHHPDSEGRESIQTLPKEVVVSSPDIDSQRSYVIEVTGDLEKLEPDEDSASARDDVIERGDRVRVEGVVGAGDDRFAFSGDLIEVEVPPEVRLDVSNREPEKREQGSSDWRKEYHEYAREYVPAFYESVPKKDNLYKCVRYVAKNTKFWERLGEKMYLDEAVVTSAYFYPVPNDEKVEKKAWDGILSDMYADMPRKYTKQRTYPIAVPVVVVYLYDGYYNAVAYLRPYGKSHKSYGYAIENGQYRKKIYDSKSEYESNTWWWTEDGWGDAGDTDGGVLDGVPVGLVD